jgi:hypothetical protein
MAEEVGVLAMFASELEGGRLWNSYGAPSHDAAIELDQRLLQSVASPMLLTPSDRVPDDAKFIFGFG